MQLKDGGFYKTRGTGEVVQVTLEEDNSVYPFVYTRKDGSEAWVTNKGVYWYGGESAAADLIEEVSVAENKPLTCTPLGLDQLMQLCEATGTPPTLAILQKLDEVYKSFFKE